MIYYFLISIVFIAELIICLFLVGILLKAGKIINKYNEFLTDAKPLIKELMQTARELSEKVLEITPDIVKKAQAILTDFALGQIKSVLGSITFFLVKREVEKRL